MREDSRRAAAEAVEPLLKFLEGLERGVALILRTQDRGDRQVMLGSLRKDLHTAAAVLSTLKSRIATADTRIEQLKAQAKEIQARVGPPIEADAEPPVKPQARSRRPRRPAGTRKKTAPGVPANLLPAAEALWREGLKTHIANKLARAGFTSWEQILETPLADLVAKRGLGAAVCHEVARALRAKGIEPARSRLDEATLPAGPRKPATGRAPVGRRKRLPQAPQHLLPAAHALWREGFQVGIANRLARLGLTSWQRVLATDLGSVKGIGNAVLFEVERIKQEKLKRKKERRR